MSEQIPRLLCLKDNHPTAIKLEKLFTLADELGISLIYSDQRVIVIDKDRDSNLPRLFMEDIEENHWFEEFPPATEYKLIYDNPLYLEQQRQEREAYLSKKMEEERRTKELLEAKAKEDSERKVREQEDLERKQLAELKAKYGE